MDLCNTCKKTFPIEELMRDKGQTKGYRNKCLRCLHISRHGVKPYIPRGQRVSAQEKKHRLDELRNVPCADCRRTFHPCAMDFDHLPGVTKRFGIMHQYREHSWQVILEEVAKCEIVCSNCHRLRTFTRR